MKVFIWDTKRLPLHLRLFARTIMRRVSRWTERVKTEALILCMAMCAKHMWKGFRIFPTDKATWLFADFLSIAFTNFLSCFTRPPSWSFLMQNDFMIQTFQMLQSVIKFSIENFNEARTEHRLDIVFHCSEVNAKQMFGWNTSRWRHGRKCNWKVVNDGYSWRSQEKKFKVSNSRIKLEKNWTHHLSTRIFEVESSSL